MLADVVGLIIRTLVDVRSTFVFWAFGCVVLCPRGLLLFLDMYSMFM